MEARDDVDEVSPGEVRPWCSAILSRWTSGNADSMGEATVGVEGDDAWSSGCCPVPSSSSSDEGSSSTAVRSAWFKSS